MSDIERISPEEVRNRVQSGNAILVCAYDSDDKYGKMKLDGSKSLSEFRSGISGIEKNREIIFF